VKKAIDKEHVLPCDFIVGHIRYGKGVKLETVRQAAERWYKAAVAASEVDSAALVKMAEALNTLHADNITEGH
jgi:hypothetical protein